MREREPYFDEFYVKEFDKVAASCGKDPEAAEVISRLKAAGYRLILATNPIFPAIATQKRIAWAGLLPSDFELVTTYENSSFSKPSLEYYKDILARCELAAEDCVMVGNDVGEDMVAERLGMRTFLLTRDLINRTGADISAYPKGTLKDACDFILSIG